MNERGYFKILPVAALAVALTVSCVSDRYRIDDIDTEAHIAPGGISVPLSRIEKKTLGEMFSNIDELVADGESGYYAFRYSRSYRYLVPGIELGVIPNLSRTFDKIIVDPGESGGESHEVEGSEGFFAEFDIPESVRTIKNIVIRSVNNIGAYVTMQLAIDVVNPLCDKFYLDDFTMQLPEFLAIADNPRVDENNVYFDPRITIITNGQNRFTTVLAELQVTNLRNIYIDMQRMVAMLQGRLSFSASARAPEGAAVSTEAMEITPRFEIANVRMTALEGEFGLSLDRYIADGIQPIELKDIFDEIGTGGSKRPDMAAPVVRFSVTNPVGVKLAGDIVFDPKDRYGESLGEIKAGGLEINGSTGGGPCTTQMFITDNASEYAPPDYVPYNVMTSGLVETIPYTIDLDVKASAIPSIDHFIDLGADNYDFGMDMDVEIPIAFGENMDLTIEREVSVGNAFSKLADKGIKASEIIVVAELEVSFPLSFRNIRAEFTDADGNNIHGLKTEVRGVIEGPPPGNRNANRSGIEIAISVPNGGDFRTLKLIETLNLSIPISGTGTVNRLNRDDYVEGRLWLQLPRGISVDLKGMLD